MQKLKSSILKIGRALLLFGGLIFILNFVLSEFDSKNENDSLPEISAAQQFVNYELTKYDLPYEIEDGFVVKNIQTVGEYSTLYTVQTTHFVKNDIDWEKLSVVLRDRMSRMYCASPDRQLSFEYLYIDSQNEEIGRVKIDQESCDVSDG